MSALIDKFDRDITLPNKRERIVAIARWFLGHPYEYGAKGAGPLDGVLGKGEIKPTDCSGLVCSVYNEVFGSPNLDLDEMGTEKFLTTALFDTVTSPGLGDIVCWTGHIGIVADKDKKKCIHAPGKGKPVRYQDWSFMGLGDPTFRKWHNLLD